MKTSDYESVLWLTLTENRKHKKGLLKQLKSYDGWFWELTKHTKCHIKTLSGYDQKEAHCHNEVMVPKDELERFKKKWVTFSPSKHWRFKHLHYEAWDESRANRGYITQKHTEIHFSKCPRQSSACRNGTCTHTLPKKK
jgi:hypothetical protein